MLGRTLELVNAAVVDLNKNVNDKLRGYSPIVLVSGTVAAVLILQQAYRQYKLWDTRVFKHKIVDTTVKSLLFVPVIGEKIQKELASVDAALADIQSGVDRSRSSWDAIQELPEQGLSREAILARFDKLQDHYHEGHLSGAVYAHYDQELLELLKMVWGKTALTNPMHEEWPLINLMEAEVISMCQALMHGTKGAPGIMTHGGTTSIVEACKAYVFEARKNGISEPEIIVPESAHIAFDKAAAILNARLVKIPLDANTGAADIAAMEYAINRNTCLLVGSAPSFPYGIIDPITEIARLAQLYKLPLHVDCCLGGFINAFAEEAGFPLPQFDFSVAGVTSISMDTHKYGQSPKGTSVLLFHPDCPASPTHVYLDWVGGMYVTEGIDGSRSGADIATTWAVLCAKGKNTYINEARAVLELQRKLITSINEIDGISVAFRPLSSVVGIRSHPDINVLVIASQLKEMGWSINIMQTRDQKADGFHFCLTSVHARQADFLDKFIHSLRESVAYAKANPYAIPQGTAKVYGKLEKGIPFFVQEKIGRGYVNAHNTIRAQSEVDAEINMYKFNLSQR